MNAPRGNGYPNQPIPPAPRAPVFARQAAHTPYGFSQNQNQGYAHAHAHQQPRGYADLSAPPPPHSLAPVAMGSERSHTGPVTATSSQRAQTVVIREKPSLKWGVMIALTGALLGGVLGLGMDAKRQQQRAAAAAEARENAPAMVATALPTQAAVNGLNAAPALPAAATLPARGAVAAAAAPAVPVAPIAARAPAVLPPAQPIAVAPAPAKAEAPAKHAKPAPVKHQSFIAAKVSAPKPPPAEKAEAPAPKPEKAEKAEKAEKPTKSAPSDARKVLEDAIKDTTNTL